MTDATDRFGLPLIQPGQAQKELFHNEALALLDGAVHPAAETRGDDVPPVSPAYGQGWIVGTAPTGDWAGHADKFAIWTGGGWRFVESVEGMQIWLRDSGVFSFWTGSEWRDGEQVCDALVIAGQTVVRQQQPAVPDASGGAIIDGEARSAIAAILLALRTHGLIAT
ncbi:DUF2793 domain-containing protein [Parasphingopyxis lamellibrachiae]|uniref:Uncharacterized protein DUF2793 n=1 Tax=Parasphingopyxis lamellibrachiae TaxID=680125 RepID=A0A3D9FDX8_9SPHN|nr:DUF2793 domain-containing protein [Parasphingopyxis lamellibrachiae]RED16034.1 uncharacterized protein DUF2793 [Parasphingopyxis lamellibrachiae]